MRVIDLLREILDRRFLLIGGGVELQIFLDFPQTHPHSTPGLSNYLNR